MTDQPNIVLVTVDSLRADHCSFMGYERETTPTLDAMAAAGLVFENAVAPGPSTPESMPAVFTGGTITDVRQGVASRDRIRSHLASRRTLPERLAASGYSTIGFTSNPFTSRHFGFDAGFDEFRDFLDSDARVRSAIVSRWMEGRFVAGLRFGMNMVGRGDISLTWEDYYGEVIERIAGVDEPFFLWVFLLEPHWPYRPPTRNRNGVSSFEMYYQNWVSSNFSSAEPTEAGAETVRSLYDGAIRHADEFLDRLVEDLGGEDPVYFFHADHGEAFGEHGSFGHGNHLYEENIHVPLVVWNAGRRERIKEPISLRSLPFILQTLSESSRTVDWTRFTRPWVSATTGSKSVARGQEWKLIHDTNGATCYDLRADPSEQHPLLGDNLTEIWERLTPSGYPTGSERERVTCTIRNFEVERL